MLAKRSAQPMSLFDSFFTDFPKLSSWDTPISKDYERTYSVAGYSQEDLKAIASPKTNRLTIKSEDERVYYSMALPSSKYDVTQANIEVNNGLMKVHIPLLDESEDAIELTIH